MSKPEVKNIVFVQMKPKTWILEDLVINFSTQILYLS